MVPQLDDDGQPIPSGFDSDSYEHWVLRHPAAVGLAILVTLVAAAMALKGIIALNRSSARHAAGPTVSLPPKTDLSLPQAKPAKAKGQDNKKTFANIEFVWIPPGSFDMGSRESAKEILALYGGKAEWRRHYEDEQPVHRVTLTNGFWLSATEVTNQAFEEFVRATNYRTDAERIGKGKVYNLDDGSWTNMAGASWRHPGRDIEPNEAVVMVSWNDADAYCRWLEKTAGAECGLPTEAEWEYACRAGSSTQFFWGAQAEGGAGYLNGPDETAPPNGKPWEYRFPFSDGYWRDAPVASFRPNAWGLYDMLGNEWEWCADPYGPYESGPSTDPKGAKTGRRRVMRGGSWLYDPTDCRSANRFSETATAAYNNVSFRVRRSR